MSNDIDNVLNFDTLHEQQTDCKGIRAYNWFIVTYNDIENLKPLLDTATKYAYIKHDKDKTQAHYHIMLYTVREISFNQLKTIVNSCVNPEKQNTFYQPIKDKKMAFRYLTHKDNPDKYQYNDSEVVCTDLSFFSLEKTVKDFTELLDDIINRVSLRDMAKKWGRDYIINRDKYNIYANLVCIQEYGCTLDGEIIKR